MDDRGRYTTVAKTTPHIRHRQTPHSQFSRSQRGDIFLKVPFGIAREVQFMMFGKTDTVTRGFLMEFFYMASTWLKLDQIIGGEME